mmetsp:Transcript_2722/g.5730  ORF Transcript_2722/g.5730 Transcript_2722/m.5730 type:complete len:303 (+) Transcript_2722:128-1036(+)
MKLIISFAICFASVSAFNKGSPRSLTTTRTPFKAYPPSGATLYSSAPSDTGGDDYTSPSGSAVEELESCKADLVRSCTQLDKPSLEQVQDLVSELEMLGEQVGVGQASSLGGLLSGEWELLYSPEDVTRSSPFFWAFRKAFPDESDQIFDITDAIPAPIKEVGPANQHIDLEVSNDGRSASGSFVSRVKVATLGGMATSIMTTRASIVGVEGLDGIRLRIESTKPEESTILEKLGPLGEFLSTNAPPFPSGDALEQVAPGSSEVVMRTTFCDEGLRISRNEDRFSEPFVWRRKAFGSSDFEI